MIRLNDFREWSDGIKRIKQDFELLALYIFFIIAIFSCLLTLMKFTKLMELAFNWQGNFMQSLFKNYIESVVKELTGDKEK